jgi:hypothetical protein
VLGPWGTGWCWVDFRSVNLHDEILLTARRASTPTDKRAGLQRVGFRGHPLLVAPSVETEMCTHAACVLNF